MRIRPHGLYRALLTSFISLLLFPLANAQSETALAYAFTAAWQRHPAAAAFDERQRSVKARLTAASAWTPAPPSLEMGARSDRYHRQTGAEEREFGLSMPLWLPGERTASQMLAASEAQLLERQTQSLRLQLAEQLRDRWWRWQASVNEHSLARERQAAAASLRDDMARRYRAGDLSKADLNAASGALAQVETQLAESESALLQARFLLQSLTGRQDDSTNPAIESEPRPDTAFSAVDHPQWREMAAQAERAEAEVALVRQQTRRNPELSLSTRRDWAAGSALPEQTVALAVRIPLGDGPRHDARLATAQSEALRTRLEAERLQERTQLEAAMAAAQAASAERLLQAAGQRARMANENRALFDKSFRLGESDWPTRWRAELEAFEAERALQRARIALALSISQWRQALGLLPE